MARLFSDASTACQVLDSAGTPPLLITSTNACGACACMGVGRGRWWVVEGASGRPAPECLALNSTSVCLDDIFCCLCEYLQAYKGWNVWCAVGAVPRLGRPHPSIPPRPLARGDPRLPCPAPQWITSGHFLAAALDVNPPFSQTQPPHTHILISD